MKAGIASAQANTCTETRTHNASPPSHTQSSGDKAAAAAAAQVVESVLPASLQPVHRAARGLGECIVS